jgi:hypothetical protein
MCPRIFILCLPLESIPALQAPSLTREHPKWKKSEKTFISQGSRVARGRSATAPLLIKGTSRREKVRKNLNPPEKSEAAKTPDHGPLLI